MDVSTVSTSRLAGCSLHWPALAWLLSILPSLPRPHLTMVPLHGFVAGRPLPGRLPILASSRPAERHVPSFGTFSSRLFDLGVPASRLSSIGHSTAGRHVSGMVRWRPDVSLLEVDTGLGPANSLTLRHRGASEKSHLQSYRWPDVEVPISLSQLFWMSLMVSRNGKWTPKRANVNA